ncbi:MAG TPA: alkaline phosphatase family protein [Actinomycetota bacterium]|nr:alkaline phosphatase family protein [Actinomycetota bacterium]
MALLLVVAAGVYEVRAHDVRSADRVGHATPSRSAIPTSTAGSGDHTSRWPIKHVIILIKENRTFDHLFGRFPAANGVTSGSYFGRRIPLIPPPQIMPKDLPHSWYDGIRDYDGGKVDGFGRPNAVTTRYAYSQMRPNQLPNYWHWAKEFVLGDDFFASSRGPSFPNHLYLIAAQSGGAINGVSHARGVPGKVRLWGCDAPNDASVPVIDSEGHLVRVPPCFDFLTEGDLLTRAGLPWSFYSAVDTERGYIWSAYDAVRHIRETPNWHEHVHPVDDLLTDVRADRLPAVTWVTPRFEVSDHPLPNTNFCQGENWTTLLVDTVMQSPEWKDTAIFVTWDDWGGFYDHVAPRNVDRFGFGFRVPLLLISPYAKTAWVDHNEGEFSSILRFVEDNWGLGQLTHRDRAAGDLSSDFDFAQPARPPDPLPLRTDCQGGLPLPAGIPTS